MKRILSPISLAALWWALGAAPAQAQNIKVDSQQKQLLLAATSTETLKQELNQAGALGFRITMATPRGNGEVLVMLERDLKSPEKVEYRLVATNATGTFQKEIDAAASQGFRFAPGTFLNKGGEVVAILEKPARSTRSYQYKLLSTGQTSTLEKEWIVAISQAFKAVGVISRTEAMILMEREMGR